MFIPLLVLLAVLGFVAWIITRPGVPIGEPFSQIIIGILVLIAVIGVLEAIGVLHTGLLAGLNIH